MKKKIHSVNIVGAYPPPYGGVSIHIQALSQYLRSKGLKTINFNTGNEFNEDKNILNIHSLIDLLKKSLSSESSIVHAHGGIDLIRKLSILYIVKIIKKVNIISTIHSGGIISDIDNLNVFKKFILRLLFNNCDSIICVNEKIKLKLLEININKNKCHVIPAFSINKNLKNVNLSQEINDFIDNHNPIFSCLGYTYGRYYGFELAIDLIKILKNDYPNVGLIIMGSKKTSDEYYKFINQFENKDLNSVLITGDLPHNEVLLVIKKSEIFLRPTYHDGDSISVREALSIGTTVIASDAEKRPDGVKLFEKGDIYDFKERVYNELKLPLNPSQTKSYYIKDNKNLSKIYELYKKLF